MGTCQDVVALDKRGYFVATLWPMAKSPRKRVKDEVVRMRISAEHKTALERAAAKAGEENLSVWLRKLALRAAGVLETPK